jgi:arylsulfatase A-like enzyme
MKKAMYPLSSLLLASVLCATFASARLPNVVLVFADDLGYGDLGCYGATKVQTPHIDRLASEGRRFTDAHSASAVCTPSRYALLTGQYPYRKNLWGPCSHTAALMINTNKLTLGKLFKQKGYATSCIGKWHLGFGKGKCDWNKPLRPGPLELGFDYYFGVPKVNSGFPFVYVENHTIVGWDPKDPLVYNKKPYSPTPTFPHEAGRKTPNRFGGAKEAHRIYDDERTATLLTEKAVKWIEENKEKPFFLYLPTTNIHHPCTPAPRFKGSSQCGLYGDFIHELDWMVGEVLACLDRNKLVDNTLVIFTSDNGGMFNIPGQKGFGDGHKLNGELLGFKFGAWEGGHRVPFVVRWPGKVKPGTTSKQLISHIDMLATFAAVTGQQLDPVQRADSVNVLPALVGEPEKALRDHLVLAPAQKTHLSLRKGKWMYLPARNSGGFKGTKPGDHGFAGAAAASFVGSVNSDFEQGRIKKNAPPAQLYDLEADPRQTTNLYRQHPEVVTEMKALLAKHKSPAPKPRAGKNKEP